MGKDHWNGVEVRANRVEDVKEMLVWDIQWINGVDI